MRETQLEDRIGARIAAGELARAADDLRQLPPHTVVAVLDRLPAEQAAVAFRLLAKDEAIAAFDRMDAALQADLVRELGHEHLSDAFSQLDPDEQARLLDELPAKVAKRLVRAFPPGRLEPVMAVLGYASGTVGREMSPVVLSLRTGTTAGEGLERVRDSSLHADEIGVLPVVTADGVLVGVVHVLDLLRSPAARAVEDLVDDRSHVARAYDDAERTGRDLLDRQELLVPVVDRESRLVGTYTALDAARVDRAAVTEDQARAGGSEPLRRPYLRTSVWRVARSRVVWLLVLAISAVLTVQVLELFEATLEQVVALALFIPLLTGIGGNTGSQSATTVTRALALGDVDLRDVLRVAFKEVRAGMLLGLTLAVLAVTIASLVYGLDIGLVVGITIAINCPIAATVGGIVPLVARACRVDPAVFSTPFISTFCDATGLLIYFSVAKLVLGI